MTIVDWIVCLGFLALTVAFGVRGRGAKTLEGYFAGHRNIPWWASGLSVMATQISAITMIGLTGQAHEKGFGFVHTYFGLPIAMVLLSIFFVPLYRRAPILTAYEYLEGRFGPATRLLTSLVFLTSRALAQGISFGAPAIVLSAITGLDPVTTIVVAGVLSVLCALFGGVIAAIWIDVQQMVVVFVGLLLVLALLLWKLLPLYTPTQMLEVLGAAGKLDACSVVPESWSLVPRLKGEGGERSFWEFKYNLWTGLIGGLFMHLAFFGCDQSQVQRILTNDSDGQSKKTLLLSAVVKLPMQIVVLAIGVLIWLFHVDRGSPLLFNPAEVARAAAPENRAALAPLEERWQEVLAERRTAARELADRPDPATRDKVSRLAHEATELRGRARKIVAKASDDDDVNFIFTRFILDEVPMVALGLVIAAIFAATLAGSIAILNALAASAVVDVYARWLRPNAGEREHVRAGKVMTIAIGMLATLAAVFTYDKGSIIEVINMAGSFFYGTLLGIFVLALVWKPAGPRAGVVGVLCGIASVLVVHCTLEVAYLWYNVVGCLGVLAGGIVTSAFERRTQL